MYVYILNEYLMYVYICIHIYTYTYIHTCICIHVHTSTHLIPLFAGFGVGAAEVGVYIVLEFSFRV